MKNAVTGKSSFNHFLNIFFLMLLIAIPTALLIMPADFFDDGKSICLFTNLSGYSCPACGLTRAIMHLIHFDFEIAYAYNMLSYIVLPILIGLWLLKTIVYLKKVLRKQN